MRDKRVVIIGAGIGGLVAGLLLASRGINVIIVERGGSPGGKIREIAIGNARVDAGPTVFTMRWVFEDIFAQAGAAFSDHVRLAPLGVLARHAWTDRSQLDLYADLERSVEAIGAFAGPAEARRYRAFCATAQVVFEALDGAYIRTERPSVARMVSSMGWRRLAGVLATRPYSTMAREIGRHLHDPRLRQLFGRYATYCGSSPALAPATLMLVAHVEREGVWSIEGGMHRLVLAVGGLAAQHGACMRYDCHVAAIIVRGGRAAGVRLASGEEIPADAVISNADAAALAGGEFGPDVSRASDRLAPLDRSLSAVTWAMVAAPENFPLVRHSVFFSDNYQAEFDDIFRRRQLPSQPTVYVCAQDRTDGGQQAIEGPERLLVLVNAPATGDKNAFHPREIEICEKSTFRVLERCGLEIKRTPATTVTTTPADFHKLFPATGGALYGRASHGWMASFRRPGSRSKIPGLYLAGGSAHPGPGVPMAALSGRAAASSLCLDLASMAG